MILDTTALSALADGDQDLGPILPKATTMVLPVIVLGEYLYGICLSRHRIRYERWLAEALGSCPVLRVDEETAAHYADIRAQLKRDGRPIPGNDIWIAALARQHGESVLSRDRHFDFVNGVERLSW